MTQDRLYPDWKKLVVYSDRGLQPQVLVEAEKYKAVIGGLKPGASIPPHQEGPAIFHFLEGPGHMLVGEELHRASWCDGNRSGWGCARDTSRNTACVSGGSAAAIVPIA